jgi:hypothetical protein
MKAKHRVVSLLSVLFILSVTSTSAWAKRSGRSGTVNFPYAASLNGTSLSAGRYKIKWQTHSPEATVTVSRGKNVLTTTQAKWVERDVLYTTNAILYDIQADGSRRVLEIRFAGTKGALIFGESSPKS